MPNKVSLLLIINMSRKTYIIKCSNKSRKNKSKRQRLNLGIMVCGPNTSVRGFTRGSMAIKYTTYLEGFL